MSPEHRRKVALLPKIVRRTSRLRHPRNQRGFTLIDMLFVVALVGLLSSLAIPYLTRARGKAQASSALGTMRVVNSGQLSFAITCGLGFYAPDLPSLGALPPGAAEAFLPPDLTTAATVMRTGYTYSVTGTPLAGAPGSCNGLAPGTTTPGYVATADPLDPTLIPRFFATNADGLIYEHTATLIGSMPEAGTPLVGEPIK